MRLLTAKILQTFQPAYVFLILLAPLNLVYGENVFWNSDFWDNGKKKLDLRLTLFY